MSKQQHKPITLPSLQVMISTTERAMDWELYLYTMKQLQGNILTVLDAAFTEGPQKKATKDLIKGYFRARLSDSRRFFFEGIRENGTWPEYDNGTDQSD